MAARGEAQADVEVSTLVVPAWRLRWRAPELALVLGERAVALASARRDEVDRLRAEALVVFASNRMGRGVRIADRALDALKAAETASERETAWRLRVELADSARSVGAPLTGFAAVRPVLEADDIPPGLRATALVQAAECLVSVGRGTALAQALEEADHLYQADPLLDHDTTLLHRGLLRAAAAGQHRRWGDLQAAIASCSEGLTMLDRLKEAESDNGQVRGRLTVELVCALLDLNKPGDASEAGTPLLERPVRAPSASTAGWLRLALATRVHLPAGRVDQARDLLRDAADSAERHQLDTLLAESLLALAHVHEVAGNLAEALSNLRSAHAAERRRARAVYAVRARLAAEFSGVHRQPAGGLHDELAALLRTGTQIRTGTQTVPTPTDTNLAPEVKQQLRQWRPVQMHRNEGIRVKRSRRAAEDMTVEGISAARAHAADRWRLVQPFGETEGDPQPGSRRRAPDPEPPQPPTTQGRPEHARSGQAKPHPHTPDSPTNDPTPHPSNIPHPTPTPGSEATTTAPTPTPTSGNATHPGLTSTHQGPATLPASLTGTPGLGDAGFAGPPQQSPAAPSNTPTGHPAMPVDSRALDTPTPGGGSVAARPGSAGLSTGQSGNAGVAGGPQQDSTTAVGSRALDAPLPGGGPDAARQGSAGPNADHAGVADRTSSSPQQASATPTGGAVGVGDGGSGVVGQRPASLSEGHPASAGLAGGRPASAPRESAAPSGVVGAGLGDGGFGVARQESAGASGGEVGGAGLADSGSTSPQRDSAPPTGGAVGADAGGLGALRQGTAGLGESRTAGAGLAGGWPGGAQRESAAAGGAVGAGLGEGGFGVARQDSAGAGSGHAAGVGGGEAGQGIAGPDRGSALSGLGGGAHQGSAVSGRSHTGGAEVGGEAESAAAPAVEGSSSGRGDEAGERSVPAAGLIAAAGAVRSGRRRAAREAAEGEGERSSVDQGADPSVLDTLKAAGLLDSQRAGGRRRAPDTEEEAVVRQPDPEPEAVVKPEPEAVQWRVEAPQRLRADEPSIDMFDSPTMVQPVVRDDVPPVGLGAAFVKGPLIPTARVPDPPDYPSPPVPDFPASATVPAPAEPGTDPVDVVAETEVAESRPVFPPADVDPRPDDESAPEPMPEPDQVPTVPEPDQVPPVPIPDPVPPDSNPEAAAKAIQEAEESPGVPSASPEQQFGPTGFLSAADVEHDDTPAATGGETPKEPFVTAVVVGGKTIDLPAIVEPPPPAPDSPSATRASRRHKSDLSLAELLAEALVAYEDARREDEAAGRVDVDEDTVPITPVSVAPESDAETTAPIQRVDPPPRFDTWTLPES